MTALPPELAAFSDLLDAQPAPVRDVFTYCLCLLMVESGKMRLVGKVRSENEVACVFATARGDHFGVVEPKISEATKVALIDVLREILREESER